MSVDAKHTCSRERGHYWKGHLKVALEIKEETVYGDISVLSQITCHGAYSTSVSIAGSWLSRCEAKLGLRLYSTAVRRFIKHPRIGPRIVLWAPWHRTARL